MRRLILPLQFVLMFALLLALTYAYLYPGSEALLDQRTDIVMSDDTDAMTLPFAYRNLVDTWEHHPSRLFYAAVYREGVDAEKGVAQWFPWSERWLVVFYSYFFPIEQLSTAFIFTLFLMNALAMYALCRYLTWNRSISSGLAIAWAFCAFTRARAKVHGAMVGTYHLPLIFLALFLIARGKGKRSIVAAAACLLLAVMTAHYFVVTCLFLSPFFFAFWILQPETRANWRRSSLRFLAAAAPAVLFLGLSFLNPIPSGVQLGTADSFPTSGKAPEGMTHPYLFYYAAQPIDYLGSDISLSNEPADANELRQLINTKILSSLGNGNAHERTNGIRWSILILSALALVALLRGRFHDDLPLRNNIVFFLIFALFTFWLSLSPDAPFAGCGPSLWLQSLISQVRVPSRAGINVHFALLMITGFLLTSKIRWRKLLLYPGVFPAVMILSYPPLVQNIPMAPIRPAISELQVDKGPCGAGLYFPFINFTDSSDLYAFVQRMRGSECPILNIMTTVSRIAYLAQTFPPSLDFLHQLPVNSVPALKLEKMARCVPLNWIVFDPAVSAPWREDMCRRLGWTLYPDLACVAPNKGQPLKKYPEECD